MFDNLSTGTCEPRSATGLFAWSKGLALVTVILAGGCEDNGTGRPCELISDAGALTQTQGGYNTNAAECPSHICTKPVAQAGVSDLSTGPYCTVQCNSDSDCNGQTRDFSASSDTRCRQGFTCAIPFGEGPLACKKLCYCRDFFLPSVGPVTPTTCEDDTNTSSP